MSLCSKPNCARPGSAVLAFDYESRKATIADRDRRQISPHLYLLCSLCAEKLRPPLGWTLEDRRSKTLAERFDAEVAARSTAAPEPVVARQITRAPAGRPEPPLEPAAQSRQVFFGFSS